MKSTKMTDAQFTKRVSQVGYVEACVESVQRDGQPFDVAQTRSQAVAGLAALKARGFARPV